MRRSIALIAAAGLSLALTACGGSEEKKGDEGKGSGSEAPAGGASLVIWTDANREAAFKKAADKYTEATGNTVQIVVKDNDQARSEFTAQAATGEGPDILFGANDWLGEFVSNGLVAPVELGDKASEFNPLAVSAFTYQGATYGVPYAVENLAIIRNTDLVDSTPATFDEMIAKGKAAGVQYPFIMQLSENGDPYTMYPFEASFTGPIFELDANKSYTNKLNLGGDQGKAFAQWLYNKGPKGENILQPTITYDIAVDAFKTGKSPYIVGGPWMLPDFKDMHIAVDPIPSAGPGKSTPLLGVQGGYISAHSKNAVLATDFLVNYVGSEEIQTALYEIGQRLPALKASADKAASDPLMAGFAKAGAEALPMPSLPEMAAVWSFWGRTEGQIVAGADPASTWDKMISDIETEMKKK
ncbi:extracellular solute-binding protein [Trueperella sp. LYQ143]|uniref:sugar ABC transporter substrate-binding protein n=1 Tax=Trueperella sp. LYQ143 TaxID=3391059 RepID=UPI003983D426